MACSYSALGGRLRWISATVMPWSLRSNKAAISSIILCLLFPRGYSVPNCQSSPLVPTVTSLPRHRSRESRPDWFLPEQEDGARAFRSLSACTLQQCLLG